MPAIAAPLKPISYSFRPEGDVASATTRGGIIAAYKLPSITRFGSVRLGPSLQFANLLTAFCALMKDTESYYPLRPFPYNMSFSGLFGNLPLNWTGKGESARTGDVAVTVDGRTGVTINKRAVGDSLFGMGDWVYIDGYARQIGRDSNGVDGVDPQMFLTTYDDGFLDKPVEFRKVSEIFVAVAPMDRRALEVTYNQEGAASFGFDWYEYGPAI